MWQEAVGQKDHGQISAGLLAYHKDLSFFSFVFVQEIKPAASYVSNMYWATLPTSAYEPQFTLLWNNNTVNSLSLDRIPTRTTPQQISAHQLRFDHGLSAVIADEVTHGEGPSRVDLTKSVELSRLEFDGQ